MLVIVVAMLGIVSLSASAMTRSEFDAKLNSLQSQYPHNSRWYDSFDGGYQCYGYANLISYNIFGTSAKYWTKSYDLSGVKAGDVIQYGNTTGSGHTIFVTNVSGDTITYTDCNSDYNCIVKWGNTVSKSSNKIWSYGFSYRCVAPDLQTDTTSPTNITIKANKTEVGVGDTVNFSYTINNATVKAIGIDFAGGNRYDSISLNDPSGTVAYTFTQAGTYCVITEGYNAVGYNCCHGIYITVTDVPLVLSTIQINNGIINVDSTISNLNHDAIFISGVYDSKGRLIYSANDKLTAGTASKVTYIPILTDAKYIKTYLWNNFEKMQPISECQIIYIE